MGLIVSNILGPLLSSISSSKSSKKILIYRLAVIASRIVSHNESGFLKGRQCICTSSEANNILSRKAKGGNMAYKIDMHKDFDTLSWPFLLQVLKCFGFHNSFITWIQDILQSTMLSIRINGNLVGFFPCSIGVRQDDPLSPLLFVVWPMRS